MNTKKGQVTIFIIIAIAIIGLAVLIFQVVPRTSTTAGASANNPEGFLEICLKERIEDVIETISLQGGNFEPELSILYQSNEISYLCYTSEDFKLCSNQQPLLKRHVESEIKKNIESEAEACFREMKISFEDRGYGVSLSEGVTRVELLPKRVVASFDNYRLTLTKGDTEIHDSFNIILNNNLYEFVGITNSILSWEALYGEAETTIYMTYYRDLKVEKLEQIDGSRVYILTDRNTGSKFQFASRSNAWPPGLV